MIPIHKHSYRSHKIGYELFPGKRRILYNIKIFKKEYLRLLNVFSFWIFLYFVGCFSMVYFVLYQPYAYRGLKVVLPKAENTTLLKSNVRDLNIFIDRDFKVVINDYTIKMLGDLELFYNRHKQEYNDFKVILYIDSSTKMKYVNPILDSLREANLLKVHFRTR